MSSHILFRYGHAIRRLRQEKNISQEVFADMCGLHRTYISDVELGKRNVSLENIEKISLENQHHIQAIQNKGAPANE